MLYTIINPSDPYTIECPDLEVAAVACVLLGGGQYGFQPVKPGESAVPLMLFGDAEAWFTEQFKTDMTTVFDRVLQTQREALATCLESVLIGEVEDRAEFLASMEGLATAVPGTKRQTAKLLWHDAKRSSLNDIGRRAWEMAAVLREGSGLLPKAPQQVF